VVPVGSKPAKQKNGADGGERSSRIHPCLCSQPPASSSVGSLPSSVVRSTGWAAPSWDAEQVILRQASPGVTILPQSGAFRRSGNAHSSARSSPLAWVLMPVGPLWPRAEGNLVSLLNNVGYGDMARRRGYRCLCGWHRARSSRSSQPITTRPFGDTTYSDEGTLKHSLCGNSKGLGEVDLSRHRKKRVLP
jgi:hypothetical protein